MGRRVPATRLEDVSDLPALRRDPAEAQLAGVCAALAREWHVEPFLVRAGMVVAAIVTNGVALAAYLIAWALIPPRGEHVEPIRRLLPFTRDWSRAALYAAVITTIVVGILATGAGPAALFIAGVVWLVLRFGGGRRGRPATPVAPPAVPEPRSEFDRLAGTWQQRLDNVDAGRPAEWDPQTFFAQADPVGLYRPAAPYGPAPAAAAARPPAARRRGRRTWFGVLTGLGFAWGTLALVALFGTPVPLLGWVAATLAVLGTALVLVARPGRAIHGRPRGLVPLTILAVATTAALLVPRTLGIPATFAFDVDADQTPVTTVTDHTNLGVGDRAVDLSAFAVTEDRQASYTLSAGTLTLAVPTTGNVVVRSSVDVGTITTPEREVDGLDSTDEWRRVLDPAAPTLTIVLDVNVGEVVIRS